MKLRRSALLIVGLLCISKILYCQELQTDSTKLVFLPKWKLDRLLQSHFYRLPKTDSLVLKQAAQIEALKLTLSASQEMLHITEAQRDNRSATLKEVASVAKIKEVTHQAEKKAERRKGRKQGFIAGAGIGLILLVLL